MIMMWETTLNVICCQAKEQSRSAVHYSLTLGHVNRLYVVSELCDFDTQAC